MKQDSNNKRIAHNTALLYFRMLFLMFLGLYTSRIVLQALGISDYGLYSLVGGFVSMLAYLNSVFVSATQRFISYAIGKGDPKELHDVFCTSITVHYILAGIILVIAETFGLWFINNHLNIEPDRIIAANWIYQSSVCLLMVNIISIPYNACIIAHEHMKTFAYVSIFEGIAKVLNVYLLLVLPFDKLIQYAVYSLLIGIIVRTIYVYYCKRHFEECHYSFHIDKPLFKRMANYAGWTAVGTLGFTFKDQTLNIVLNLFYNTAVNAARGIAVSVSGMINQFASNFFLAVTPQITKRYAKGDIEGTQKLVYTSAKFAFFMLGLLTIPLCLNLQYLLELWLGVVPEYTYEFIIVILISTLIASFANPVTNAIQATGNIRNFQIGICLIFIMEIPIAYILLKNGASPYIALCPAIATQFFGILFRFYLLRKQVPGYSFRYYLLRIVLKSLLLFALTYSCLYYIFSRYESSLIILLVSTIASLILTSAVIYIFGLEKQEKRTVDTYLKKALKLKRGL